MSDDFYQQLSAKQLLAAVKADAEIAELRRKLAVAERALTDIRFYDKWSEQPGICPYGCDCPNIARQALDAMK